jgi:hypothetical protein
MQRSLDFALLYEDKSCFLNGLIREPIQSMVRVEGFVVEIDRSGDKNGAHRATVSNPAKQSTGCGCDKMGVPSAGP